MLAKSRAEKKTAREAKLSEGSEAFMPDDGSVGDSSSTWGVVNVDSDSADPTEDLRVPSSKLPWAISMFFPFFLCCLLSHQIAAFESGGLTISCTVLYPEQFDALRRTYDCEKSMVESLSRCVKWNASGGKSGSAFLKTRGLFPYIAIYSSTEVLILKMIDLLRKNYLNPSYRLWKLLLPLILTICLPQYMLMLVSLFFLAHPFQAHSFFSVQHSWPKFLAAIN